MNDEQGSKADQLERDFGIPAPVKLLNASLRRRDSYTDVTPLQRTVAGERLSELVEKGFDLFDAFIILFMRGARIECVAKAVGESVEAVADQAKARRRQVTLEAHADEAQRLLRIAARV